MPGRALLVALLGALAWSPGPRVTTEAHECDDPAPGWIWCDDFERDRTEAYFEYGDDEGDFVRTDEVGLHGSTAMRARFQEGETAAGHLHLAFGRTPDPYVRPVNSGEEDHREIFWRLYLRHSEDWRGGGGNKLSRATILATPGWAQAMIAHVWSGSTPSGRHHLAIDPASGTDPAGRLRTSSYNDFENLRWLGAARSRTPLFHPARVGTWYCVEAHVRLNDPGASNGIFELWIDGEREAARTDLNWVGSYEGYGINAVFVENYWNEGSVRTQERFIDNFVVSTERVGC